MGWLCSFQSVAQTIPDTEWNYFAAGNFSSGLGDVDSHLEFIAADCSCPSAGWFRYLHLIGFIAGRDCLENKNNEKTFNRV